jgi:type II secretory pathway component PulF
VPVSSGPLNRTSLNIAPIMVLAFQYSGYDTANAPVRGVVYAVSRDFAYSRLKTNRIRATRLRIDPAATLRNWISSGFELRDLERFYRSFGQRLANGTPAPKALESCRSILRDPRLRQATQAMQQQCLGGAELHAAMAFAGFSRRDAMLVRAAEVSGNTPDTLKRLADDVRSQRTLKSSLSKVLAVPVATLVFLYVFLFLVVTVAAPKTLDFFAKTGATLPPFAVNYFEFTRLVNANPTFATLLFVALPVLLVMFMRTAACRRLVESIPLVRDLSVKAELAGLWNGFAQLLRARIPPATAAGVVRDAARRTDTRGWFTRFGHLLETGVFMREAAARAGFPALVAADVAAADESGRLPDELERMVREFEEDVVGLSARLADVLFFASMLVLGAGIVVAFFLSYGPIMAIGLRNV